jgi:cell division protein FtsI (penicillin-binding protein 3)
MVILEDKVADTSTVYDTYVVGDKIFRKAVLDSHKGGYGKISY